MAEVQQSTPAGPEGKAKPPPDPLQGAQDGAREAAEAALNGKPEDAPPGGEEALAAFLLGDSAPIDYPVKVKIAVPPSGELIEAEWILRQLDGALIDSIELRNMPDGPLGKADELATNAELVVASTQAIKLPSGRAIDIRGQEFMRGMADPSDALRRTFGRQEGILGGLAAEIRSISGWSNDRVGKAQAKLVRAVGG